MVATQCLEADILRKRKAAKPGGSQEFYDKASSVDKTLKFYEGHYHDMLNDIDKDVVMNDILEWLDKRS